MLDGAREKTASQTGNGEPGTKETEALASALNHSAERVQTLWFTYLTFTLYLLVAVDSTTDRMLFLEDPLRLPLLDIRLPLVAFYGLAPFLFVVFHFYMLLSLVLLSRTAKSFEDSLARAFPGDGEARENFRMRIENTLFVQLLVGAQPEREGINAKLMSFVALVSLALFPMLLLMMFEGKFESYRYWPMTWWHWILLFADLGLIWTLWPGYRSGWGLRLWPKRSWRLVWPGIWSAAALALTTPAELIMPLGVPFSTLDLLGEDLIDGEKLARIEKNESAAGAPGWEPTLPLKERDLTGANLTYADVRHVEFFHAILNRANLRSVWAKNARFVGAQL